MHDPPPAYPTPILPLRVSRNVVRTHRDEEVRPAVRVDVRLEADLNLAELECGASFLIVLIACLGLNPSNGADRGVEQGSSLGHRRRAGVRGLRVRAPGPRAEYREEQDARDERASCLAHGRLLNCGEAKRD